MAEMKDEEGIMKAKAKKLDSIIDSNAQVVLKEVEKNHFTKLD